MGGLEVRAVDNSWIKATPIENTILINVGDLLEIFRYEKKKRIREIDVVIPPFTFTTFQTIDTQTYFLEPLSWIIEEP